MRPYEMKKQSGVSVDNTPALPGAVYREKMRTFVKPGLIPAEIVQPIISEKKKQDFCNTGIGQVLQMGVDQAGIIKGIVVGVIVAFIVFKVIK